MVSLVTDNFRINSAQTLVDSISNNNYYFYLGGFKAWTDENNPPNPTDTIQQVAYDEWDSMFGAKKVNSADVRLLIPRVNWTSGTVYDHYDPAVIELARTNNYVMSNDAGTLKVYKCIENNSGGQSTTQPTDTGSSVFTTADGYKWKFMYTINASDAIRFVTPSYMPISQIENGANADTTEVGLTPLPVGGHGFDNINELGAYYVGINVRFEYDENGTISTENDFRTRGLVYNPTLFGTTTLATGTVYRQSIEYTLTVTTGTFVQDELVEGTTPSDLYRVIEYNSTTSKLYVKRVSGSIIVSDTITGQTSNATSTVSSISTEQLEPNSGKIMFIENRKPTSRAIDQIESQTLIIEL